MQALEITQAGKPPVRGLRPKHRWLLAAVGLILSSPFLGVAWVRWDYQHSISLLEERVGSLDPKTFSRPPIPDSTNGAQAFLAAGAALRLSEEQEKRLAEASKTAEPANKLAPEDAALMLVGNNRAVELARRALERGDDDWDVDFRLGASAPLPNYIPQLHLSRLCLLGGNTVLNNGDRRGAVDLAVLMARQVDSLYSGGPLIQTLIGRAAELFLHRLLHQLLREADLSEHDLAALSQALPKKDLRTVWLETVRREASFSARDPKEVLAEMWAAGEALDEDSGPTEQGTETKPPVLDAGDRVGMRMGEGLGIVLVEYMMGGTLKWWAKASAQWEASPTELKHRLAIPESKLKSPFGKLRNLLSPDFADALARLREAAAARELLTTALALRQRQLEQDLGCAAAWESVATDSSALRLHPLPDGRCRLENIEIAELRRAFPASAQAAVPMAEIVLPNFVN